MLVLSRQKGQQIYINDTIVITIVEFRGGKVRIGIEAPKGVRVVRSELVAAPPVDSEPENEVS